MNRITALTTEQEARLKEYAKRGIKDGLSTEPIDENAAQVYSKKLMNWLGREYEDTIFVDSPLAACYAAHYVASIENKNTGTLNYQVGAQVRDQVGAQVSVNNFLLSAGQV